MYTADLDLQTLFHESHLASILNFISYIESVVKPSAAVVTTSNTNPSGPAIAAAWSAKATLAWNLLV